jgi:nucleoside-diphosphate-sugar epimerase
LATYLITGIAGFIGSALARALLERGDTVRGLDNFSTGRRENLDGILSRIDLREADLNDNSAVASACDGVDYILHQAAIPSVPRSVSDPVATNRANIDGTLSLLVAARDAAKRDRRLKRVVYAASSSAYGDQPTMPKHEAMIPQPLSPYAVSKITGEYYMQSFFRVYGLETVSLRYFNIFGPRQDPGSPYSGVLAKFINAMLRGESPTIQGDGEQSRDFTYVDNAVLANLVACEAPASNVAGGVFNVGCGERFSVNQTFRLLQKLPGFAGPANHGMAREGDVKHSLADISLAKKHLGYRVLVGFEEGLRRTVEWYRESIRAGGGSRTSGAK